MPRTDIQLPPETTAGIAADRVLHPRPAGPVIPATPITPTRSLGTTIHDGIDTLTHKTPFGRAADLLGNMPKGQ